MTLTAERLAELGRLAELTDPSDPYPAEQVGELAREVLAIEQEAAVLRAALSGLVDAHDAAWLGRELDEVLERAVAALAAARAALATRGEP